MSKILTWVVTRRKNFILYFHIDSYGDGVDVDFTDLVEDKVEDKVEDSFNITL